MKRLFDFFFTSCLCATFFTTAITSASWGQFELEALADLDGAAMYSGDYENAPPFIFTRSARPQLPFRSAAAAAPFALGAFTSGHTIAGGPGFNASASFTNAAIVFDDSENLRSLIPSEVIPLEVLLHFRAEVDTSTTTVSSYSPQAFATLTVNSPGSGRHISGHHWDLSRERQLSAGVFRNFSPHGGDVEFAVPLKRISPYVPDGLTVRVDASVSVFSSAILDPVNTATSFIWLSLIEGPGVLTLADGRSLTDLGVTYRFLPGRTVGSLENPILPTDIVQDPGQPLPTFDFRNVITNQWYDPPIASGFIYTMTDGSLFTDILDFPPGFSDPFTVSVGDQYLGTYLPGQAVDFVSLLGEGVTSFKISGISPLVDPEDPLAFPLKLAFNTPTASFTMQAVPESSGLTWIVPGVTAFSLWVGKRRSRRPIRPKESTS